MLMMPPLLILLQLLLFVQVVAVKKGTKVCSLLDVYSMVDLIDLRLLADHQDGDGEVIWL